MVLKNDILRTINGANKNILFQKNTSNTGVFTMDSGKYKKTDFGKLLLYENKSRINVWGEGKCNDIESAVLFQPAVDRNRSFNVFSVDLCR